jgi:hypothetical protein
VEFLQAVAEGVSRAVNGEVFPEGKVRLEVSPGEPEDLAEGSLEGQEALAEKVSQDTKEKGDRPYSSVGFGWPIRIVLGP